VFCGIFRIDSAERIDPFGVDPPFAVASTYETSASQTEQVPKLFRVSEQHSISPWATCTKAVPLYLEVSLVRFCTPDFTFPAKNLVFTPKTHPNVGSRLCSAKANLCPAASRPRNSLDRFPHLNTLLPNFYVKRPISGCPANYSLTALESHVFYAFLQSLPSKPGCESRIMFTSLFSY
jgi:hypothetical protein